MSGILSQKRSAMGGGNPQATYTSASTNGNGNDNSDNNNNTRYNRLLSILAKSLTQSREKVASDASQTIKESYGDMTSLFTSSEDSDGVSSLVDLLLGKLDSVHDRFNSEKISGTSLTQLETLLQQQNIYEILQKMEHAIDEVETEEREFNEAEEADKNSARDAIKLAKSSRISPSGGKKRRVMPAESIGYHAHKLKLEYQQSLLQELENIEKENDMLEEELKSKCEGWQNNVEGVKDALDTLDTLGNNNGADNAA